MQYIHEAPRCLVYCYVITNTAAVFSVYACNITMINSFTIIIITIK